MPDILARIDAAVGCQQCAGPLGDSPSDDFCSESCQDIWRAQHVGVSCAEVGWGNLDAIGWYDRDGVPLTSVQEWGRLHVDPTYVRVALSTVTDAANSSVAFDVSTVWLGLDHGFGDGLPLIFETMVFATGSLNEERMTRYSTEQQARDGHIAMVIEVASELTEPVVADVEP